MKHFIYKTTHINGKYYIGRHSTENLDDGYIGSGNWPLSIKDKSTLTREILEFVDDFETLKAREGEYLQEHYGKPNCMNGTSDPVGFGQGEHNPMNNPVVVAKISGDNHYMRKDPDARKEASDRQILAYNTGSHPWNVNHPNLDGRNAKLAYERGNHSSITNNPSTVNAENGTHHWQNGNSPNYQGKLNKKLIDEGRHNFLGPETNQKRIDEGTHNFVGSASNLQMLAEGRHPSQKKKTCKHCGKTVSVGMYKRWHGNNCKKKEEIMTISLVDRAIIEDLKQGLTPVQLSLKYEREGKDIPSTYIKFVKDCVENDMFEFLTDAEDATSEERISSVATTPRQYEAMRKRQAGV